MAPVSSNSFLKLWAAYERPLSVVSLIIGFSFDLVIAKRPDSIYDNVLLLAYLLIAAGCIIILNRRALRPGKADGIVPPDPEPLLLLLILQFCFGGLSSNLLVLYGKSGTPAGDVLFIGILGGMLIGNEFLRSRYSQLRFNLAVYYTLLLTYLVIAVPTFILHSIGTEAFLISGGLSLAGMALFISALSGSARLFRGTLGRRRIVESSAIALGIFLLFNGLYFSRLIPPVPLSLKAIGIYHMIVHGSAGYEAWYEPAPWWEFWADTSGTYHAPLGSPAYCFSSIFAPTGLTTPIVHRWEWYDPAAAIWRTEALVTFPITGGRTGGYYGYSIKSLDAPGSWRCDVETTNGSLIGRTTFTEAETSSPPLLSQIL